MNCVCHCLEVESKVYNAHVLSITKSVFEKREQHESGKLGKYNLLYNACEITIVCIKLKALECNF